MSGVPFRGVSSNSDARFSDKERKLLKSMKFPKEYEQKVDFKNVKIEAMKPWIAKRVTDLLGIEDEVLVGYIYEQLEGKESIDPRLLQINLTGFLEKNTSLFVKELWLLMASASDTTTGIPQQLLDEKEAEEKRKRDLQESLNKNMRERQAAEREKRDVERREQARRDAKEREERQRQRERDRREDMEREQRRRDREREERAKLAEERAKRREEMYQKEKERDEERRKKYEARKEEDRRRDRERQKERERDKDRTVDRDRGTMRDREQQATTRQEDAEAVGRRGEGSASPALEPKRSRDENGATQETTLEEPKNKKVKKDKKEKKDKKAKKEKKDKKEKAKQKMSFASPSGSSHSDASLQGRRSLEDDLRKKALLSVRRD